MSVFFIALGGNLGDVVASFRSARRRIAQLPRAEILQSPLQSSLLYRTPPLGPPDQPDYYNAVISIACEFEPLKLLDALQSIEAAHGRVRAEHWGARTLDLDIIAMDAAMVDTDRLSLPHPQMQFRQFVLRPLCDIAPNWQHPRLQKTAAELLNALQQAGEPTLPKGIAW